MGILRVLLGALDWLLGVLEAAIFVRVIISWLPVSRYNGFIRVLYQITEPILAPVRNLIERSAFGRNMMFDISPIVAVLIIEMIRKIIY